MAEWYNFDKINQAGCAWNWVVGARRIGKTVSLVREMCDSIIRKSETPVWIRDYQVQFNQQFCSRFLSDAKRLGYCPDKWIAVPQVGVFTDEPKLGGEQVAYFQSINTSSNSRGGGTLTSNLILFDEFMPEKGRYPRDCHRSLQSIVTTYTDARDNARVYCCSNFISSSNPYFVGNRIYPDIGRDITVYDESSMAIELCRGYQSAKVPTSGIARGLTRGGYPEYAEPTAEMFDLIKRCPKNSEMWDRLIYSEGRTYQIRSSGTLLYVSPFSGTIPRGCEVHTADGMEITDKISFRPTWLYNMLKMDFENSRLRFDSPNTMFAITKMFFNNI